MQQKIELRSEKARNIIGKTPPSLISTGIFVTSFVICGILFLLCAIPYPRTMNLNANYNPNPGIESTYFSSISLVESRELHIGQAVILRVRTLQEDLDITGYIHDIIQEGDSVSVYYTVQSTNYPIVYEGYPAIGVLIKTDEYPILSFQKFLK